jgi:hypothetical protein
MKKILSLNSRSKTVVFLFATILFKTSGFSQDTLHLNYIALQTKMPDSTEAKITNWAKNLNGKHMDLEILAYYSQSDFKKYSTERSEDVNLIVLRKARDFVTIKKNEVKKSSKSQRSLVDIIYWPTGTEVVLKEREKKTSTSEKKEPEKTTATSPKKENKKEDSKVKEEKSTAKNNEPGEAGLSAKEKKELKAKQEKEEKDKIAAEKARKAEFDKKYGVPDKRQAGEGQWVKRSEVAQIKASKLVVAEIGNKPIDDQLFNAVKSFWNFTSEITSMPYNEAKALAKTDEKVVIIFTTKVISKSLPKTGSAFSIGGISVSPNGIGTGNSYEYVNVSAGVALMIENGNGKILAASYIPGLGENGRITPESIGFGVSEINYLLKTMDEKDLASNLKCESAYKENALNQLKEKTLYIPQMWLDKSVDKAEIPNIYKAKSEVVSYEVWKDAILNKKEGVVYLMISPRPVGGEFVYYNCLIDAKTGAVYGVFTKGGFINSKSNTATVTKSLLEKYNAAVSGDW